MNQISKFIISVLMEIAIISITFYYTYDQTCQILREKFSGTFDGVIMLDMNQRADEINMISFSYPDSSTSSDKNHFTWETEKGKTVHEKTDRHQTLTRIEKTNHATQSYLQMKNPVRVSRLDSLFRVELGKDGIVAPTMVSYTDNRTKETRYNDVTDSHSGKSFYETALSTERRTLGAFEEFSLQGFVQIKPMTVFRYAPLPFILLLAGGIIAGMLTYVLIFRKRKASALSGATNPDWPFQLDTLTQTFIYPGGSVKLKGDMVFRLFACLWNSENRSASYEDIATFLYGKGVDTSTGKRRMTQTVRKLRDQLDGSPVTIGNMAHRGYRIERQANALFVSSILNKMKRIFHPLKRKFHAGRTADRETNP